MHLKRKLIYFLSLFLTLCKAPFVFAISAVSVLEKFQYDYSIGGYLSSGGAQVSVFFPLLQGKKSLLWVSGRYGNLFKTNLKKEKRGVRVFERLSGGVGYRYRYDPAQFFGVYCYLWDQLDANYYFYADAKSATDTAKYLRINPGFEWVSDRAKFNLDGYWLWHASGNEYGYFIKDRYGASLKLSSTFFRKINPFIVAYYGKIDRREARIEHEVNDAGVKGIGIGMHWAVHRYVNIEIAPATFDTLNRYSCFGILSVKVNNDNVNTMSIYKKLHQPVNRYQPLYAA